VGTNNGMFHRAFNGGNWEDTHWEPMGDATFTSAPAAVSFSLNRLDVFAVGNNARMFHNAWNGMAWTDWDDLGGGPFRFAPAAVARGHQGLDVFALNLDGKIYHNHRGFDGSGWSGWEAPGGGAPPSGGVFNNPPAVVSWGPDRLDVFALGTVSAPTQPGKTVNEMFHLALDGNVWLPWAARGGVFNSPPAVASWGPNRLDVFALSNNEMLRQSWNGSAFLPSGTDWEDRGAAFNSTPAVTSWGPNRLDVFGVSGADNEMFHQLWDGIAWSAWSSLGGKFTSAPAVVSWGVNRLDVFGLGTDDEMHHSAFDNNRWTGWDALGGVFKRF
jgi:hypothetical protein